MDCVDSDGSYLSSQLSALGYFNLAEDALKSFKKNIYHNITETRISKKTTKMKSLIDCVHTSAPCIYTDIPCMHTQQPIDVLANQPRLDQGYKSRYDAEESDTSLNARQIKSGQCYLPYDFSNCKFLKKRKVFRTQDDGARGVNNELLWNDSRRGLSSRQILSRNYTQSGLLSRQRVCSSQPRCISAFPDRLLCDRCASGLGTSHSSPPYVSLHYMYVPPKLRKTDPVEKYYEYKIEWDERENALLKKQNALRNSIRKRMMKIADNPNTSYQPIPRQKVKQRRTKKEIVCPWDCKICGRRPCFDINHCYM